MTRTRSALLVKARRPESKIDGEHVFIITSHVGIQQCWTGLKCALMVSAGVIPVVVTP